MTATRKLETKLGIDFISNLRLQFSERGERLKIFKTHGGEFQRDISDYIGCYNGRFIAIEFKVFPNNATHGQLDFLSTIIECEGIGFIVEFNNEHKGAIPFIKWREWGVFQNAIVDCRNPTILDSTMRKFILRY